MKGQRRDRGYSLMEMMVGLAIAGVTMTAIMHVMLQLTNLNQASRLQNLVNDNYLLGLHVASHPGFFADRGMKANPLGISAALNACLSQKGSGCDTLSEANAFKQVPDAVDAQLNASFSYIGTCQPTEPGCLVTRSTTYKWDCPTDTYCSGLRLNLEATPILKHFQNDQTQIKKRSGSILIPARQFVPKAEVSFTCPSSGTNKAIFGIDYTHLTDQANCSNYDSAVTCTMPMSTYVDGSGCVAPQQKGCGDGFTTAGLFSDQSTCVPASLGLASLPPTAAPNPTPTPTPAVVGPGVAAPGPAPAPTPAPAPGPTQGQWYYQINMGVITQPPVGAASPCPPGLYVYMPCSSIGQVCTQAQNIDIAHFQLVWQCYDTSTSEGS